MSVFVKFQLSSWFKTTDWQESRSRLGLETEVYETLGLVSVSCEILNHVQSRSRSRFLWKLINSLGLGLEIILQSSLISVSVSSDLIFKSLVLVLSCIQNLVSQNKLS